jgi:2,4-dienoyl-CoA reductase-like NADH-dependent reductase (Old Yellow Enzyme family)
MRAAEPFALAGLELRNRLVGTAHGRGILEDGLPLPGDAEYWRRVAAGGAAMLTVGGTVVAPESTWRRRITTEAWRAEAVPGMALRAEAIRAEGAVAACQLVHLGRETTGAEQWFYPVAPSAARSPREPTRPRRLSAGEVDAVVEGFRVSAVNAAEAGFQVIELHAAHGYLLAQFLAADGLSIVARIAREIRLSAPDVVVGVRLSVDDVTSELLPDAGALVDYVNLTVGVRTTYVRDMATEEPPLLDDIGRIR